MIHGRSVARDWRLNRPENKALMIVVELHDISRGQPRREIAAPRPVIDHAFSGEPRQGFPDRRRAQSKFASQARDHQGHARSETPLSRKAGKGRKRHVIGIMQSHLPLFRHVQDMRGEANNNRRLFSSLRKFLAPVSFLTFI